MVPKVNSNSSASLLGSSPNLHNSITPPIHWISIEEAQEHLENGLCYYCDKKFVSGHRCEKPQLFMIADSTETFSEIEKEDSTEYDPMEVVLEISYHAIAGASHQQTIRVMGKLQNKDIVVLIDGDSMYNFIDQAIVSKFSLPIVKSKKIQVMVANKEKVECAGLCQALTIKIQGVQWLATLGPIETDYSKLTMMFKQEGKTHTFGVSTIDYLGHIISDQGVAVDPSKIEAIQTWLTPTTTKGV
ncbi:hypothetical protein FEM48_Zijuj05G0096400 [Ziziphus jujuba var. spinosa]|uniref:Uncharacterized protein n=1 Tax=Ziziphus jujuba var. spinosa TaxID=714518 RepID=A0A978VE78_ZIZJJ|nr:hypothetical protein FEM48_Zijuj05G0096400 [Ziziphus jujuba var. spinosa]